MVSVSVSYNMKLELKRQHNISDKLLICLGPRLGLGIWMALPLLKCMYFHWCKLNVVSILSMNTKISLFTCHLHVVIFDSNFVNAYKLCVLLAEIMDPASQEQYARQVVFSRCGFMFGLFLLVPGIGLMAMGYSEPSLRYFCHSLSCYIRLISRKLTSTLAWVFRDGHSIYISGIQYIN